MTSIPIWQNYLNRTSLKENYSATWSGLCVDTCTKRWILTCMSWLNSIQFWFKLSQQLLILQVSEKKLLQTHQQQMSLGNDAWKDGRTQEQTELSTTRASMMTTLWAATTRHRHTKRLNDLSPDTIYPVINSFRILFRIFNAPHSLRGKKSHAQWILQ